MPLAVGTRLGNIEILGQLGAGGMGEVYRGLDTKLDREVAVKVLPPAYAQHPERLARFEREAKVLASLNHPNIATIYAVEESPDGKALVMELVKGQTLTSPVPLDTALKYAAQIASALDAAHEKGITHRDLKPANIMVTPDGTIKVLDFGLAAVTQPSQSDGEIGTNIATLTMSPTSAGMIMGTAAYMSPEQASGQTVDRRADIWSFGVVLWELLTGKPLFHGTTVSHILASVLKDEPVFTQVPYKVRRLLRRCLEKDPQKRLLHIGDALELVEVDAEAAPVASTARSLSWFSRLTGIVAAVLAVAALPLAFVHFREQPPGLVKLSFPPPDKGSFRADSAPAVSPDGRRIAFVATVEGKNEVWVRDLDSDAARRLPTTEDAHDPFWSPDGRYVAFFTNTKLRKIALAGGPAVTLCDAVQGVGGTWSQNDVILFANNTGEGIFRVPAAGGSPAPVTKVDRKAGQGGQRLPSFLPDGKHFVFFSASTAGPSAYLGEIDTGSQKLLFGTTSNAIYAPPGYLLSVREGTLLAQPFEPSNSAVQGEAVPVAEQVDTVNQRGRFSVSKGQGKNGVLAYIAGNGSGVLELTWFDRSGKTLGTIGPSDAGSRVPAISPDGNNVAMSRRDPQTGQDYLWLHDLVRGTTSRFTFGSAQFAIWSPDGRHIAFKAMDPKEPNTVSQKSTDASGLEEVLDRDSRRLRPTDWSYDGRYIFKEVTDAKTHEDIWVLPQFGDRKPFPYLHTEANEQVAKLSPNGRWLAYYSDETGRPEVYVQSFPAPGGKWQVSTNGGRVPVWSRDGKELFFIGGDGKMMAVKVKENGSKVEAGVPEALFDARFQGVGFDVAKDGRFLIPTRVEQTGTALMTVVLNWQVGLKK